MNARRLVAALVAVACVAAMGVASTTLDSSLDTNPDDVVNLDWDRLPISAERAGEIQGELQRNQQRQERPPGDSDAQTQRERQQQQQRQQQEAEEREQQQEGERDPLERLWERLLDALPSLLGGLALVAAGLLLRRYWKRLLGPLLAPIGGTDDRREDGATARWTDREPRNEAERAWFDLVRRAGVDRPHAKTPSESAAAAVDAGFDRDAVEALRRTFEEVRYGGGEMTDEQRRRLERGRDELDGRVARGGGR